MGNCVKTPSKPPKQMHKHPLEKVTSAQRKKLNVIYMDGEFICIDCKKNYSGGTSYNCKECLVDMCESCYNNNNKTTNKSPKMEEGRDKKEKKKGHTHDLLS